MAKSLTFEYDARADILTIGGKSYPSFRSVGGRVVDSPFIVESRGGGVFHLEIPAAEPVATTVAATGNTPKAAEDAQTIKDEAAATARAAPTELKKDK